MNDMIVDMTEEELIKELSKKVSEYDPISFYEISSKETIRKFDEFKKKPTEETAKGFVNSINLDDFIKILSKMLITKNPKDIRGIEDFVTLSHLSGQFSNKAYMFFMDFCGYRFDELIRYSKRNLNCSEKEYVNKIVHNFSNIFPNYVFVQTEYTVKRIGRIDIFAKDRSKGYPVIIECKKNNHNPTKQLLAYGSNFTNPILIGITEEIISAKNRHDGIEYLTYQELGIGD